MIPYGSQWINDDDIAAVTETLREDLITQGPTIEKFEEALREEFGCEHAVVVTNGTVALELVYRSLGITEGKRVITSTNTFVATCNAVARNDGIPVLADVNPRTYNLDPESVRSLLRDENVQRNIAGITAVHFAGLPCDMESLSALAEEHDLFLLEDACHAPGAKWRDEGGNWHRVGACERSDAAVLSFHPVKHFTSAEGGAVLTNDEDMARDLKKLRTHGIVKEDNDPKFEDNPWHYEMRDLGTNARLSDLHASLGLSQLKKFPEFLERRRERARRYDDFFDSIGQAKPQHTPEDREHAYHLYTVRTRHRDELFHHLQEEGIQPQVHYIPVHRQPYYRDEFGYLKDEFPEAESYYEETISLPLFPALSEETQDQVIASLDAFYEAHD